MYKTFIYFLKIEGIFYNFGATDFRISEANLGGTKKKQPSKIQKPWYSDLKHFKTCIKMPVKIACK